MAIMSLLIVIFLFLFATRVATLILIMTGLSHSVAKFQARSAITGTGFTTAEAELMMRHPLRRKVALTMMLFGHVGIIATMSTAIISFVTFKHHLDLAQRIGFLILGLGFFFYVCKSRKFELHFTRLASYFLKKYLTVESDDPGSLFHLPDDYRITELILSPTHPWAHKSLSDCHPDTHRITVLGIMKKTKYLGHPPMQTIVEPNDILFLYGTVTDLKKCGN